MTMTKQEKEHVQHLEKELKSSNEYIKELLINKEEIELENIELKKAISSTDDIDELGNELMLAMVAAGHVRPQHARPDMQKVIVAVEEIKRQLKG